MTQDFISLGVWEIIATWANTLILFLILKKLFFNKVKDIIAARENELEAIYQDAKGKEDTALQIEKEYEGKLSIARSEASEIVKTATQRANAQGEQIVIAAKEQAENIVTKAQKQIDQDKKQAMNDLRNETVEIALSIAEKAIEREITANDRERLVDDFIRTVGEA